MELRHLRYFVAVVEEESFTKAAERLFIAQPPLSRQMQNLEAELDIALFERGSRPLKTTEAGQFFYQHALKLLANAEALKAMTQRVGSTERRITVGFVSSLMFGLLPKILYIFKQQYPHIKIDMVDMSTAEQIEALKEGRIDVGCGRLEISDPAIQRVRLRQEPLMVAIHESHPLALRVAAGAAGIYLSDMMDDTLILYPKLDKPNYSTQIKALFAEHGLEPKHILHVRDLALACSFAAMAEGLCVVPSSARHLQLQQLSFIPILDEGAVSPVIYAMRKSENNQDINALFECVYQAYEEAGIAYQRQSFNV